MLNTLSRLSLPISYKLLDGKNLYDARNVFDNKGITETRNGVKRYNSTALPNAAISISYFKDAEGVRYKIVKCGTELYSVMPSGAHTLLKSGLSSAIKHRGVTLNNRHIISCGSDGLFQFNGTVFTVLGQAAPTAGTATMVSGGSLTDAKVYTVGLTFESSVTGFESNVYQSEQVTTANPNQQIDITAIPDTADNATIDRVNIYLKNVSDGGAFLFVGQISLGITTYSITTNPLSTQIPPTKNDAPITGGGSYLTTFGARLVYSGNSTYKNDVFFSEEYIPDAFDTTATQLVLQVDGQGPITGIASGLYSDQYLNPFLVIFKKTSTHLYSELNGNSILTPLDTHVGCVSHDTIRVRNGSVYFMSENGWYIITNGVMQKDQSGTTVSLSNGNIDDIFSRTGWAYQLNSAQFSDFFSVYYPTLGHYMTFVSEGANSAIYKCYNFEERIGGFRVFEFPFNLNAACEGEDDLGFQTVFMCDQSGFIFTYSVRNEHHDESLNATPIMISSFALLPFIINQDHDKSYNFRNLVVRALSTDNDVTVRVFNNFNLIDSVSYGFSFDSAQRGFTLDLSRLDIDVLSDERVPITSVADINTTGETILIGFYQDIMDANIGLISAQLNYNQNGNRNL